MYASPANYIAISLSGFPNYIAVAKIIAAWIMFPGTVSVHLRTALESQSCGQGWWWAYNVQDFDTRETGEARVHIHSPVCG